MKKIVVLVLSFILCFSLVACSDIAKIIDEVSNNTGEDNNNNGKIYGDNGGGTSQNTDDSHTETMKSEDEVKRLIGEKYLITVKAVTNYSSSGETSSDEVTFTSASNGEYAYLSSRGEVGNLYRKLADGTFASYEYNRTVGKYTEIVNYPAEINPFINIAIVFYAQNEIEYSNKSSVTFLNRPCTKYEYSINGATIGTSVSYNDEWIIDNATGMVLKHNSNLSGNVSTDYGSASALFEVTSFEVGSEVDTFLNQVIEKIAISEWDEAFLKNIGLQDSGNYHVSLDKILEGYNGPKELLISNSAELEYYDNATPESYESVFYLTDKQAGGNDQQAGADIALLMIQNLFNCGAKYTEEGNVVASYDNEQIFWAEQEDGNYSEISFEAIINGWEVEIDANWQSFVSSGRWVITLSVCRINQ